MGGQHSHQFDQKEFNQLYERCQSTLDGKTIWQLKSNPSQQIEQYAVFADSDSQIKRQQQLFNLRKNSNQLIAATHLKETEQRGLCSNSSRGRLFLERIPHNLQSLRQIPFPDILHLHWNALNGYKKLSKVVGHFRPQQQQIGFNQANKAKVWLSGEFSSSQPGIIETSQQQMVHNILQLIEDHTDRNSTPRQNPSIINYIYSNRNDVTFDQALQHITQYASRYNKGQIPKSLTTTRESKLVFNNNPVVNQTLHYNQIPRTFVPQNYQPISQVVRPNVNFNRSENINQPVFVSNQQHMQIPQQSQIVNQPRVNLTQSIFNQPNNQILNQPIHTQVIQQRPLVHQVQQSVVFQGPVVHQQFPVTSQNFVQSQVQTVRPPQPIIQQIVRQPPPIQVTIGHPQQQLHESRGITQSQLLTQTEHNLILNHHLNEQLHNQQQHPAQRQIIPDNNLNANTTSSISNSRNALESNTTTFHSNSIKGSTIQVLSDNQLNSLYNKTISNNYSANDYTQASGGYKNINMDDGKSSSALLAELRGFSTPGNNLSSYNNYESYETSTRGNEYTSKYQYNSNKNSNLGQTYENLTGNLNQLGNQPDNDYSSIFNKYARGEQGSQVQGQYHVEYDPEILADIMKIKN